MEISRRCVALSSTLSAKDLEIFNTPYLSQNGGYVRDKDAAAEVSSDVTILDSPPLPVNTDNPPRPPVTYAEGSAHRG
jgi:hypothetical protein